MRKFLNSKAFSLIEVMVVVAIVGIITAIAVPTYEKHKARTKRVEAKLILSGIYMSEAGLMQVYGHYATCLTDAQFSVAAIQNRHYSVGFSSDNTTAIALVNAEGGECNTGNFQFAANNTLRGQLIPVTALSNIDTSSADLGKGISSPGVTNDGTGFVAGAIGYIFPGNLTIPTASQWTINHEKQLIEINEGF